MLRNETSRFLTGSISSFEHERKYLDAGYDFVVGIDEAGRGPLAGPVVACATFLKCCHPELVSGSQNIQEELPEPACRQARQVQHDKKWKLIRDSKLLSEKQREELYDFICEHFHIGIGICDHETIDRINILEATYLAMKKAIVELRSNLRNCHPEFISGSHGCSQEMPEPACLQARQVQHDKLVRDGNMERFIILVDGNKTIPNCSYEQKAIVGGDNLVKSISAASIVAKVTRDRIMRDMHASYPEYCFDQHKGYGTALHVSKIKEFGPCKIHRKSFAPCK